MKKVISELLQHWKSDPDGTYSSWFLWPERLKNFRSIRQGLIQIADEIEHDKFGRQYRNSSLETVVSSIAEQRQIFRGADHAFLWKPKMRIPDIYENRENQMAFGKFLRACLEGKSENEIIKAIANLDNKKIKGLGPAAANLIYFLHPTILPPFNTAIVRGYSALARTKMKLGRWDEYLAMRTGLLRLNEEHKSHLSNDLGAVAGFMFDIGSARYKLPASNSDEDTKLWERDLAAVRTESGGLAKSRNLTLQKARLGEATHTEIQSWLRDLGHGLGFDVWVASNDQSREVGDGRLGDRCLCELPSSVTDNSPEDLIRFIDVLWLKRNEGSVIAAFEVEHSTSIYSGILRLYDLALSPAGNLLKDKGLYLVAPDDREEDVRNQLQRPAFKGISNLCVRFLSYGEFQKHRENAARFGEGLKAIEAIAKRL